MLAEQDGADIFGSRAGRADRGADKGRPADDHEEALRTARAKIGGEAGFLWLLAQVEERPVRLPDAKPPAKSMASMERPADCMMTQVI